MPKVHERSARVSTDGPAGTAVREAKERSSTFVVTSRTVDEWRSERDTLERDVPIMQKRLALLNARLRMADFLLGEDFPKEASKEPALFSEAKPLAPGNRLNFIDAIERIANGSPRPISKAELRQRLCALGFPLSSFNNYFYGAIRRLKWKERVRVLEDGSLWKAPTRD